MLRLKKDLKKVAVTGGLSCGKSLVCHIFQELGAYVVSADEIVHVLLSSNQEIIQEVVKLLGTDILIDNQLKSDQINRSKIAEKVFNEPLLLKSLEHILHPAVQEEIRNQYELKNFEGSYPLFVAEIPLLFETKSDCYFDFTITVIADVEICKKRFKTKSGLGSDEFTRRQNNQLSNQEKSEKADYVIINNGSLTELRNAVLKLYETLTKQP